MTDTQEAPPGEPSIEEIAREELAEALDRISERWLEGKGHWSSTTIPIMLRPVLIDLNRHLQPPNPAPAPPPRDKPPKTSPPPKTLEEKRRQEERWRWTANELGEAIRGGL
jgi:hypothetical protein